MWARLLPVRRLSFYADQKQAQQLIEHEEELLENAIK